MSKEDDKLQAIMDNLSALATVVQQQQAQFQQQQEQINNVMRVFGGGGNAAEGQDADLGPPLEEESNGKAPPTYPYHLGDDKAKSKLVDLCFDTPLSKLPALTETPRMQVTPTAYVEAMNEFIDNMGKTPEDGKQRESFDMIFIRKRDQRMKSVGRKSLMEAMAFSQIQEEKPEIGEGAQMGF